MEIVSLGTAHVADVTRLLNGQLAPVPPGWQFTPAQVWEVLQHRSVWEVHYEDEAPPSWTWTTETLCVVDGDHVRAAGRFDHRHDDSHLTQVSGRWLVGDPTDTSALRLLVDHLTAQRKTDATAILVNGRHDFGLGWSGIPASDAHVTRVLAEKGFVPFQQWVVMTADMHSLHLTEVAGEAADIRWRIDASRGEWNVDVYDGDIQIGECQSWGVPAVFAGCAGYGEWMQIEWLGVEEPYRRRGLARQMLVEQLRYHTQREMKHCFLYTGADNIAARTLNESLGFEVRMDVHGWMWKPTAV